MAMGKSGSQRAPLVLKNALCFNVPKTGVVLVFPKGESVNQRTPLDWRGIHMPEPLKWCHRACGSVAFSERFHGHRNRNNPKTWP